MARAVWKPPFVDGYLLKKAQQVITSGKMNTMIKTWSRRSTIIPDFVGLTFCVYNGKKFIPVQVKEDMVNHKLVSSLQQGILVMVIKKRKEVNNVSSKKIKRTQQGEARSYTKSIRISPRKLGLVAGLIRGLKVQDALNQLTFSKKES